MKRFVLIAWIGLMAALFLYVGSGNNAANGSFADAKGYALIGAMALWYWLPTVIAMVRDARNATFIAVVNLLAGWTGIGGLVALAMSLFFQKNR